MIENVSEMTTVYFNIRPHWFNSFEGIISFYFLPAWYSLPSPGDGASWLQPIVLQQRPLWLPDLSAQISLHEHFTCMHMITPLFTVFPVSLPTAHDLSQHPGHSAVTELVSSHPPAVGVKQGGLSTLDCTSQPLSCAHQHPVALPKHTHNTNFVKSLITRVRIDLHQSRAVRMTTNNLASTQTVPYWLPRLPRHTRAQARSPYWFLAIFHQ